MDRTQEEAPNLGFHAEGNSHAGWLPALKTGGTETFGDRALCLPHEVLGRCGDEAKASGEWLENVWVRWP